MNLVFPLPSTVFLGGFDISIAESSSTCSSRMVDVNPSFSISQGGNGHSEKVEKSITHSIHVWYIYQRGKKYHP